MSLMLVLHNRVRAEHSRLRLPSGELHGVAARLVETNDPVVRAGQLLERDLRLVRRHLQSIVLRQPIHRRDQVHLALAVQHRLAGVLLLFHRQRRIGLTLLLQRTAELGVVLVEGEAVLAGGVALDEGARGTRQ